jgi:hypothetical protein
MLILTILRELLFLICLVAVVSLLGAVGACIAFATEISRLKSEMASLKAVSSSRIKQLNASINMVDAALKSGLDAVLPASSCTTLPGFFPFGYYWVRTSNGSAVRVYCDMTRLCDGVIGGWVRVAELDTTDSSRNCPDGLERSGDFCRRDSSDDGCSEVNI